MFEAASHILIASRKVVWRHFALPMKNYLEEITAQSTLYFEDKFHLYHLTLYYIFIFI